MKKDIMITIRLSKFEKDAIDQIKKVDPSFGVSKFLRDSLLQKSKDIAAQIDEQNKSKGIGDLKIG